MVDLVVHHAAIGADSSSSTPVESLPVRALVVCAQSPRFFFSKLTQSFAPGPCPSILGYPIVCSGPGLVASDVFAGRLQRLLHHRRSPTCRGGHWSGLGSIFPGRPKIWRDQVLCTHTAQRSIQPFGPVRPFLRRPSHGFSVSRATRWRPDARCVPTCSAARMPARTPACQRPGLTRTLGHGALRSMLHQARHAMAWPFGKLARGGPRGNKLAK